MSPMVSVIYNFLTITMHWRLTTYYKLAFVFQLKYWKKCQTLAQIIQLNVLEYGDQELGSLIGQKKDKSMIKVRKFNNVLQKCPHYI